MQDCSKCGKKIKTLYERHGAKATYEAMGYYCNRCGILYDKDLKKCAHASSMLAASALITVHGSEQDRKRLQVEPLTVTSRLPTGLVHERECDGRDLNPGYQIGNLMS
jgi:hypothetical protein